jgi:acetyl esterase/lipase
MALRSWEHVYDAADLEQIVTPAARPSIARIARNCLYKQKQILASVPSALLLGFTFLHSPVWETEPWKTIAEENTPGASPIDAPVLVVQGGGDHIVDPQVTERFVEQLCAKGETAALRLYPGVGHLNTGHDAAPDVAAWITGRFAAEPAPTTCGA